MTDTSTTVAADLHHPTGGHWRIPQCDDLAPTEHHIRAVRRRLHPHSPCAGLGLASHRHILGNGTCRPTMLLETSMVEIVAASHVIGVLLSECVE